MKIVLFNGPPGCGKDTAAAALMSAVPGLLLERLSFVNKRAFAGTMNLVCDHKGSVDPYEQRKDEVVPVLGVSYRQWQIDFAEKFMKPMYGQNIFVDLLIARLERFYEPCCFVIPDCGFQQEYDRLVKVHGERSVLLVLINRPGKTFDGDSRGYIAGKHPFMWSLQNDGTVEEFNKLVVTTAGSWLKTGVP